MEQQPKERLDKWLWQARFFKTRGLSAQVIEKGRVRVNGARVTKPGKGISPGVVLTFVQGDKVRVVRVCALADRRGPASEAQLMYEELPAE